MSLCDFPPQHPAVWAAGAHRHQHEQSLHRRDRPPEELRGPKAVSAAAKTLFTPRTHTSLKCCLLTHCSHLPLSTYPDIAVALRQPSLIQKSRTRFTLLPKQQSQQAEKSISVSRLLRVKYVQLEHYYQNYCLPASHTWSTQHLVELYVA